MWIKANYQCSPRPLGPTEPPQTAPLAEADCLTESRRCGKSAGRGEGAAAGQPAGQASQRCKPDATLPPTDFVFENMVIFNFIKSEYEVDLLLLNEITFLKNLLALISTLANVAITHIDTFIEAFNNFKSVKGVL